MQRVCVLYLFFRLAFQLLGHARCPLLLLFLTQEPLLQLSHLALLALCGSLIGRDADKMNRCERLRAGADTRTGTRRCMRRTNLATLESSPMVEIAVVAFVTPPTLLEPSSPPPPPALVVLFAVDFDVLADLAVVAVAAVLAVVADLTDAAVDFAVFPDFADATDLVDLPPTVVADFPPTDPAPPERTLIVVH